MTIVAVNGAGNIPHENVMDGTSNTIMVGEYCLGQPSERETFGQPITFTYTIQPGSALQGDDQSLNRIEQATDPINIVGDGSVRFVSQTISPTETILPYIEQRGAEPGGDGVGLLDGGFVIDWTPADNTSPASEVNHSEFSIVKLLDAATPKLLQVDGVLDYSGGDGRTSGPVDDLIGWDFRPDNLIGGPGIDFVLDLGGNDGGEPKQMFAQILQQMTQGGSPPDAFDFTTKPTEPEQIKEVLVTSYNMGGDPLKFAPETDDNALTVDPTDPNASVPAHTPEWSNLRSSDPMETPGPDDNVAGLPAVQTGAWIADVTYERPARPECANNLKQIALAVHALDAGEICAQDSPPASPAPDNSRGYTAGHFALELEGHNASPPVDYGTGSFIIQNVSDPATIDASLVFDSTGGDRSTVLLLPYIEQHGGEADDGGLVIDWTTGDGPKGGDRVGVIAIIAPTEHGSSILEFSIENHPNNPLSPGELQECVITKSMDALEINDEVLVFSHEEGANDSIWIDIGAPISGIGYGNPSSFQINSAGADDMARSFDIIFATQTAFPQRDGNSVATESLEIAHEGFLGDHDDGWCMGVRIDFPESVHALFDLVV